MTQDDVFAVAERLVSALWAEGGQQIETPFPRMRYAEAMERFGTDRPDLRYGVEIFDASDVFRETEFGIARQALESGGRVRGIRVPKGAALSRKQVDELEAVAKSAGAGGLVRLKRANGSLEGPVAKFLSEGAAERLALEEGDLCLLVAARDRIANPALDRVRQESARVAGVTVERAHRFLWVVDFPLFAVDPETGALVPEHHPFTSPHPDDLALLDTDPARARAQAYDIVYNGLELASGSIRISDPALQSRIFRLLGIDEETARHRFGFLLEGLRAGAPPHGGVALGFDRIAMLLAGASSLREVIAFPKTTAARALFESAPTPVPAGGLRELHIEVVE